MNGNLQSDRHTTSRWPGDFPATRQGAVTVIVLITILIISSVGLSMLQTTLQERELTLRLQNLQQSEWLVESGITRAVNQLQSSAEYKGEVWELSKKELGSSHSGRVTIQIAEAPEESTLRTITVIGDYPANPQKRIRSRREIVVSTINLPTTATD